MKYCNKKRMLKGVLLSLMVVGGVAILKDYNLFAENVLAQNKTLDQDNGLMELKAISESIETDGEYIYIPSKQITFIEAVEDFQKSLNKYEQTLELKDLKDSIYRFGEIPKVSKVINNTLLRNSKELNSLFKQLRSLCYSLGNESDKKDCIILLAEEVFLGWKYKKESTYFRDEFLIDGIIEYNKTRVSSAQKRLNYLYKVISYYEDYGDPYPNLNSIPEIYFGKRYPIDGEDVSIGDTTDNEIPPNQGIILDKDTTDDDKYVSSTNPNIPSMKDETINIPQLNNTTSVVYKKEGNKCYKVESEYVNGNKTEKNKTLVHKSDYVYCGIYDYVNFSSSVNDAKVDIDYLLNDQNKESEYFLYYTVNANEKKPYYYNSGIRADKDNKTLSFNQLRDGIYQIIAQINAFAIDSNEKSLYIIDGEPVVLRKEGDKVYSEESINKMLERYPKLKVKIKKESNSSTEV